MRCEARASCPAHRCARRGGLQCQWHLETGFICPHHTQLHYPAFHETKKRLEWDNESFVNWRCAWRQRSCFVDRAHHEWAVVMDTARRLTGRQPYFDEDYFEHFAGRA